MCDSILHFIWIAILIYRNIFNWRYIFISEKYLPYFVIFVILEENYNFIRPKNKKTNDVQTYEIVTQ